jgi:hypothetical protein
VGGGLGVHSIVLEGEEGGASKTQNQPFGAWFGAHCGLKGSVKLLQGCRNPPAGTYRVREL